MMTRSDGENPSESDCATQFSHLKAAAQRAAAHTRSMTVLYLT